MLLNVVTMPYLLAAAIPIVALFLFIRNYYLKSAREIKRLEAMSKSINVVLALLVFEGFITIVVRMSLKFQLHSILLQEIYICFIFIALGCVVFVIFFISQIIISIQVCQLSYQ